MPLAGSSSLLQARNRIDHVINKLSEPHTTIHLARQGQAAILKSALSSLTTRVDTHTVLEQTLDEEYWQSLFFSQESSWPHSLHAPFSF